MLETNHQKTFSQGVQISSRDPEFGEALKAAVDYRGDVTVSLKDGSLVEGFLYNSAKGFLDLFPKNSPQKRSLPVDEVEQVIFSGADEAAGKSWDDWVKKRESLKAKRSET